MESGMERCAAFDYEKLQKRTGSESHRQLGVTCRAIAPAWIVQPEKAVRKNG
jgi:hypothetical protein